MISIRRLFAAAAVLTMATMLSGCMFRPFGWDAHERHDHSGAHSEHQQRDDGRTGGPETRWRGY